MVRIGSVRRRYGAAPGPYRIRIGSVSGPYRVGIDPYMDDLDFLKKLRPAWTRISPTKPPTVGRVAPIETHCVGSQGIIF